MYIYNYCEHESYLDENVNERILRYALIRFTLTWCVTWFTYYVQLLYKKERVFFTLFTFAALSLLGKPEEQLSLSTIFYIDTLSIR